MYTSHVMLVDAESHRSSSTWPLSAVDEQLLDPHRPKVAIYQRRQVMDLLWAPNGSHLGVISEDSFLQILTFV